MVVNKGGYRLEAFAIALGDTDIHDNDNTLTPFIISCILLLPFPVVCNIDHEKINLHEVRQPPTPQSSPSKDIGSTSSAAIEVASSLPVSMASTISCLGEAESLGSMREGPAPTSALSLEHSSSWMNLKAVVRIQDTRLCLQRHCHLRGQNSP